MWATFVVRASPAVTQHCRPRPRVPVPGCSEVSQPGLLSRLVGRSSTKELMMRVFVAGATGAIGKELVPRLVEAGHEVHGMTRSESKQAMLDELGAVPAVADALDPDQVAEAVGRARPNVTVHQLTALGEADIRHFDRDFALTNRLRTEGTDNLVVSENQIEFADDATGLRVDPHQRAVGHVGVGHPDGARRGRHDVGAVADLWSGGSYSDEEAVAFLRDDRVAVVEPDFDA
jgi:hypothetical protein